MAVNRTEVAVFVGPLVPDVDVVVEEVLDVGVSGDEPEEFMDDPFQENLLRRQEREPFLEVEPHLVSEDALGSDTRTVVLDDPFVHYPPQQV